MPKTVSIAAKKICFCLYLLAFFIFMHANNLMNDQVACTSIYIYMLDLCVSPIYATNIPVTDD